MNRSERFGLMGHLIGSTESMLVDASQRETAYKEHQQLLTDLGGKVAEVRFPSMAASVTDNIGGFLANQFFYSNETSYFLQRTNDDVYQLNDRIFNKLRQSPGELFDPVSLVPGMESDQLGRPPKSGLEFDLQMVKVEQNHVEKLMNKFFECFDPQTVLAEVNATTATNKGDNLNTGAQYLGGRLTGYENKMLLLAAIAFGRDVDFTRQSDRRVAGYATAFLAHGYSEDQFLEFNKTGKLP